MAGDVAGVFHPAISVSDLDEAVRYYRDLLGLRVTFDDDHDPAAISALFGYPEPRVHAVVVSCPDGSELELVRFAKPQGRTTVDREPSEQPREGASCRSTCGSRASSPSSSGCGRAAIRRARSWCRSDCRTAGSSRSRCAAHPTA